MRTVNAVYLRFMASNSNKQMFQGGKLGAGDRKAIKEFPEKYIVSEKLVADYI